MTESRARRAAARLARSLRQVHDLRDACPVSNVSPLFPGPKYAGPQAERYRVAGEPSVDLSVDYCSGCGICSQVCPQGVKIAEINAQARDKLKRAEGRAAARPDHHPPDLARARRHAGRAAGQLHARIPAARGSWPRRCSASTATPPCRSSPAGASRRWAQAAPEPARPARKIVYFHGCGTEYYEPWEGEKVVAILEHNGFEVVVPKQDCCGLPLQSSGLFDDARKVVLRLARALAPHLRRRRTRSSSATPPAAR